MNDESQEGNDIGFWKDGNKNERVIVNGGEPVCWRADGVRIRVWTKRWMRFSVRSLMGV